MLDFKNCVMKITSKYSSQCLVTLQGKLKLTEKENISIRHSSLHQCTSHQPILVPDLG